ncbi:hypothetical protein E3V39_15515 [Gammaproteobacteria bacterium LSUCC0112]|nr:hypothetical protein E3V39_15515 [Gammaproteobacteria bacterium LSUCC0112]
MNSYRRVLLALMAGNVLLALWYLIVPAQDLELASPESYQLLIHRQEMEVLVKRAPEVALASMVDAQLIESENSVEPPGDSNSQCFMLGPFESEEQINNWFGDIGVEFDLRGTRVQDINAPLYRAYSPAVGGRSSASVLLSEIRDAIQRAGAQIDSYIVSSGPLENAISLGLFGDQANALNVQRILVGQRVNVLVEPELRFINHFWLVAKSDYYADFKRKIDSMPVVLSQAVSVVENLCETIAQAE